MKRDVSNVDNATVSMRIISVCFMLSLYMDLVLSRTVLMIDLIEQHLVASRCS
jgi:hypothetical protein